MKLRIVLAFAAALLCQGAHAAALVERIGAMLARPELLCGRFEQQKRLAGIRKPLVSNGRFCVIAGKGVAWQTLTPFASTLRLTRDEIVQMQGDRVAMRIDAKQEPTVRMINSVLFSLLGGDLAQLETMFEVQGSADAGAWKVVLKARQPALAKAIGTISLDGAAYVKSIRIDDAAGDRTSIVFADIKTGAAAHADMEALF